MPPSSKSAAAGSRGSGGENGSSVSPLTINRLSVYLRSLRQLRDQGVDKVSSQQLARRFHLSSTQIRKDLAQFGEFGTRGVGYDVVELANHLESLVGLDRIYKVAIVGMGNIGTALARFPAFNTGSFQVVAAFDNDPAKIGQRVGAVVVRSTSDLALVVQRAEVAIGVVAVPAESALAVFDALARAGVHAVVNFAPTTLPPRAGVRVKNVDLRIHLEELAFYLSHPG